jgi:NitT/TauT family transport system ATP-binding protein
MTASAHAGRDTSAGTSETATPILQFLELAKTFRDGTAALSDINLAVARGEFLSIVGPSGCGKSTLLRIASGLAAATRGGVVANFTSLGYVFQDPTLLPWRTVERNIEVPAMLEGIAKDERARLVREAIELVGLAGFEKHYPRALSGGMKMRASLARSLTLTPDLFLFDEPFSSLDAITRERLNEELLQLYASRQFTGVFVTHAIPEAVYLSSRVVVLSGRPGRVIAEYQVPFTYPRSPEFRYTEKFTEISRQVAESLRENQG